MRNLHLNCVKKIHMIGIGGVSMSGLASYLIANNYVVSGSDIKRNNQIEKLIKKGLKFYGYHKKENINKELDLVVYSGAIKDDNPEIVMAKSLKIKLMERSELLGEVARNFANVLSISGTHGKTTTTAYLSQIFIEAGLNPTISIGGNIIGLSNFIVGANDYFICEACEFRESFKYLKSSYAIITNIEADHLDYYKTFENVQQAFLNFASKVEKIIITYNNEFLKARFKNKVINCGDDHTFEYNFKVLKKNLKGVVFEIYNYDTLLGKYEINQTEDYNIINSFLSIVLAKKLGISNECVCNALLNFNGVERRNEKIGEFLKTEVYADYAHHPTEIFNSIKAYKEKFKKVFCVFQPHTFSRTKSLIEEFKKCFNLADKVCFFKTYPAREPYDEDGCEKAMFDVCLNKNKVLFYDENELFYYLKETACDFDVVLVLGAGDLYDIMKKMFIN